MNRALMLGIVGVLISAVFVAFVGFGMHPLLRVFLIAGSVTGIVWLTWREGRRDNAEAERVVEEDEQRLRELRALAQAPAFELIVSAPTQITLAIVPFLMAGVLLWWGILSEPFLGLLSAALFLCLGALGFLRIVPEMGAPVMAISRKGFTTPLTPQIPWNLVEGIYLHEYSPYGGAPISALLIKVNALSQHIAKSGPYARLLYWLYMKEGDDRLTVTVANTNERPEVIYGLMRTLWTESTGRSHDWNPFEAMPSEPAPGMPATQLAKETSRGGTSADAALASASVAESIRKRKAAVGRRVRSRLRTVNQIRIALIALAILFVLVHLTGRVG